MFVVNKEKNDDNFYVFILVHGYESSSNEMKYYENGFIELLTKDEKSFIVLNTKSRENKTSQSISNQIELLRCEIENLLRNDCIRSITDSGKEIVLIIIGHSMGGVVVFDSVSKVFEKEDWMKNNKVSKIFSGIVTAPILGVKLDVIGLGEFIAAIRVLKLIFSNGLISFATKMIPNFDIFIQYLNIFDQVYINMDPDRSVVESLRELRKSIRKGIEFPISPTIYITANCDFTMLVNDQFGFDYNLLSKFNSLVNRLLFVELPNLDLVFTKMMGGSHDGLVPYSSMVPILIPAKSEESCWPLSHGSILRSYNVIERMYEWFMNKAKT